MWRCGGVVVWWCGGVVVWWRCRKRHVGTLNLDGADEFFDRESCSSVLKRGVES